MLSLLILAAISIVGVYILLPAGTEPDGQPVTTETNEAQVSDLNRGAASIAPPRRR